MAQDQTEVVAQTGERRRLPKGTQLRILGESGDLLYTDWGWVRAQDLKEVHSLGATYQQRGHGPLGGNLDYGITDPSALRGMRAMQNLGPQEANNCAGTLRKAMGWETRGNANEWDTSLPQNGWPSLGTYNEQTGTAGGATVTAGMIVYIPSGIGGIHNAYGHVGMVGENPHNGQLEYYSNLGGHMTWRPLDDGMHVFFHDTGGRGRATPQPTGFAAEFLGVQ